MFNYKIKLKQITKAPRTTMTGAEIILWSKLRMKNIDDTQFFRQKRIGKFIVDFYCPKAKLIIELDNGLPDSIEKRVMDRGKEEYFKKLGLKVIRIQNKDVRRKIRNVMGQINNHLLNNDKNKILNGR